MKFRNLFLSVLMLVIAGVSVAQESYPGYRNMQQQIQSPGPAAILQQGLSELTRFMNQEQRPGRKQLMYFAESQIAPYFDFQYMARWAGGQRWRLMDDRQRQKFGQQLKSQFLAAMIQKLSRFEGQRMRVLRQRRARNGQVTVAVAIQNQRRSGGIRDC